MLVILLNCVTLGMFHPCEDSDCDSERCKILEVSIVTHKYCSSKSPEGHYHAVFPRFHYFTIAEMNAKSNKLVRFGGAKKNSKSEQILCRFGP